MAKHWVQLILLAFALAFLTCLGEAETSLKPPEKTKEPKADIPASTTVTDAIAEFDKAQIANDAAGATRALSYLLLIQQNVSPVFHPKDFEQIVADRIAVLDQIEPNASTIAKNDALRYLAFCERMLFEGVFENAELVESVMGDAACVWLATRAISFEMFSESVRLSALRILFISDSSAAFSIAEAWLKLRNIALQMGAVYVLGYTKSKLWGERFAKGAFDKNSPLELKIEYALAAERCGVQCRELLGDVLCSPGAGLPFRLRALEALVALGREVATPYLVKIVAAEAAESKLLLMVLEQLAEWNVTEIVPHLSRFFASPDKELKRAAVRVVRLLKVERFHQRVSELLTPDENPDVLVEVLRCLSDLGDKVHLAKIAEMLYTRDFKVRLEAALAVQKLWERDFGLLPNMEEAAQEVIIRRIRAEWQTGQAEKEPKTAP